MGDSCCLSCRTNRDARAWVVKVAKEEGVVTGQVISDLYEAICQGSIKYENRIFSGENEVDESVYSDLEMYRRQITELNTTIKLQEAKIRGLEEKQEPQKFPEKEKEVEKQAAVSERPVKAEGLDTRQLVLLAMKHRITEQSLLDMALRPYR